MGVCIFLPHLKQNLFFFFNINHTLLIIFLEHSRRFHSVIPRVSFFFIFSILFIFRERERKEERGGEKHRSVASCKTLTGGLACNPGMCPDWESNQQPFVWQAGAQSTEPHQPGPGFSLFLEKNIFPMFHYKIKTF